MINTLRFVCLGPTANQPKQSPMQNKNTQTHQPNKSELAGEGMFVKDWSITGLSKVWSTLSIGNYPGYSSWGLPGVRCLRLTHKRHKGTHQNTGFFSMASLFCQITVGLNCFYLSNFKCISIVTTIYHS